jgi:hypothetical protein
MSVSVLEVAMANAWRPDPGTTLVGALAHREVRTSEFGTYPIVYIAVEGSEELVAVHAFHQTLRDGLKELAPQRGQFISITYVGEKESKNEDSRGNKRTYHHYVVVDPDDSVDSTSDLDWDNVPY